MCDGAAMIASARLRTLHLAFAALAVGACSSSGGTAPGDASMTGPADAGEHDTGQVDAPTKSDASHADAKAPHDASHDVGTLDDATAKDATASDVASHDTGLDAREDGPIDASVTCLDPSTFSTLFTITDPTFCAVAMYTTSETLDSEPSWGTHNGPLTLVPDTTGGGLTLERWTAPASVTGALTKQTTHVAAGIPSGAYAGAQANDLPFFGWTGVSWTGPGTATTGQVELISSGAVATTYTANGPYGMVGVPASGGLGRLLFTGLSPLGAPTTDQNGLYAADACSTPMDELGAGTGCAASSLIDAWGEDAGPITADSNGDVFAVLSSATTATQEARGYIASSVARGAAPVIGTTLFTVPGVGFSLAALAPSPTAPGVLLFQPIDTMNSDGLDVIEQAFTTSTTLAASGTTSTLLTVVPSQASQLAFMVDGSERVWVAGSGTSSTTYVVLVHNP
jgi:hypothetical protein